MTKRGLYWCVLVVLLTVEWVQSDICTTSVCEYTFDVRWDRTMTYRTPDGNDAYNVILNEQGELEIASNLYRQGDPLIGTILSADDLWTGDGFPRNIITINDLFPGPTIEVMEGAEVQVTLINHLRTEGVSIHFHGMYQRGSSWMDGVPYVTQCPLMPGQKFTHIFKAYPAGTHWYHSHLGGQRLDGLHGALIVHKQMPSIPEFHMLVNDLYHVESTRLDIANPWHLGHAGSGEHQSLTESSSMLVLGPIGGEMEAENELSGTGEAASNQVEQDRGQANNPGSAYGDEYTEIFNTISITVNGRGRQDSTLPFPLTTFEVSQGIKYRFRVINTSALKLLQVSVDQHKLVLVASDGFEIEPIEVDMVIVMAGERWDFELVADQPIDNYWIRVKSQPLGGVEGNVATSGEAILHYTGSEATQFPTSAVNNCTTEHKCLAFNCPSGGFQSFAMTDCMEIAEARAVDTDVSSYHASDEDEEVVEMIVNFGFNYGASINARMFLEGGRNADFGHLVECDEEDCEDGCQCVHIIQPPFNKTIQMTLSHYDAVTSGIIIGHHTIHLHGSSFTVMKIGYPEFDSETQEVTGPNLDIDCITEMCPSPVWRYPPTDLNYENPPIKDSVIVPTLGYTVIRFRSDNPGNWFFHCHIEGHSSAGMAAIVHIDAEDEPYTEDDFPDCQYNYPTYTSDSLPQDEPAEADGIFLTVGEFAAIVAGAGLGVAVLILVIVGAYYSCRRRLGGMDINKD